MNSGYAGRMSRLEAFCRALILDYPPEGMVFDSSTLMQYLHWKGPAA